MIPFHCGEDLQVAISRIPAGVLYSACKVFLGRPALCLHNFVHPIPYALVYVRVYAFAIGYSLAPGVCACVCRHVYTDSVHACQASHDLGGWLLIMNRVPLLCE